MVSDAADPMFVPELYMIGHPVFGGHRTATFTVRGTAGHPTSGAQSDYYRDVQRGWVATAPVFTQPALVPILSPS
jgi:hypothetical protein